MSGNVNQAGVFGATGRTGQLVVAGLVSRGWNVRALARSAGKLPPRPEVDVVPGDSRSPDRVSNVITGCQVVFSCLGMTDITIPSTDFSDSVTDLGTALGATLGLPTAPRGLATLAKRV